MRAGPAARQVPWDDSERAVLLLRLGSAVEDQTEQGSWFGSASVHIPSVLAYDEIIARAAPFTEYHQNRYARELDAVVVGNGCRWLDVGAGSTLDQGWIGVSPEALARRAQLVIGCDLVSSGLAANRALTAAVIADGTRLPYLDGSFDLVTANMVLEHLPECGADLHRDRPGPRARRTVCVRNTAPGSPPGGTAHDHDPAIDPRGDRPEGRWAF